MGGWSVCFSMRHHTYFVIFFKKESGKILIL